MTNDVFLLCWFPALTPNPSCQQGYMLFYLFLFLKFNFTFNGKSSQVKLNWCLRKGLTRQKCVSSGVPVDLPSIPGRLVCIHFLHRPCFCVKSSSSLWLL